MRVVFNASEPGSAPSINLTSLTLNIYGLKGTTLFTAHLDQAYTFPDTFSGTGNSGFVFALTASEALQTQTSVFDQSGFGRARPRNARVQA